jgi:hypothetical protein
MMCDIELVDVVILNWLIDDKKRYLQICKER